MNHLMLNDEDSRSYFLKLLMFLKFGFTPLIYGLGDKLGFIKEFTDKCLPKYYCLIVEPSEDFRFSKILNEIFVKILNYKESLHSDNIFEDLDEIMSENDFEICLIIINADNEYFTKYLKEIFSLSSITNLHLIMTFEYINSEMLFHDELLKNAIFMNINTFEFGNFIQNPEVATKIALKANHKDILLIADSLPKSAKEVLAIIGKMRINNRNSISEIKVKFLSQKEKIFDEQELFRICKKNLSITSLNNLQLILNEFVDHNLIRSKGIGNIGKYEIICRKAEFIEYKKAISS